VTHTPDRVLVIGATGRVGRAVVDGLLGAGVSVRALARRPAAAGLPAEVEVVAGDLTLPESLEPALRGAATVFLVWTAPPATAAAVVERLAAGPRRVVLLSSPHQTPHPFFQQPNPLARFHAELERLIAASGLDATILRPGMFASNTVPWWSAMIADGNAVRWPYGAVETAPIDDRDIAAVAARALIDDRHAGADYVMTGPQSLTQADQVRLIGEAIGRRIAFDEVSPDAFRQQMTGRWPPAVSDMLLAAWQAALGQPAYTTTTVADVLGRPARTFAQWAADHADAFARPRGVS
jgi:uncharacterized protein YbjT (DUF2867 family)